MAGLQDLLQNILGRPLNDDAQKGLSSYITPQPGDNANPAPQATQDVQPSSDSDDDQDQAPVPAPRAPAAMPTGVSSQANQDDDSQDQPDQPKDAPITLNFGDKTDKDALAEALKDRDSRLQTSQLQRGLEQLSGGIARLNPNTSDSEAMTKNADTPLNDYQLKQKDEVNNPNSGISKGMRDYMRTLGVNVSEGATAEQMKSVLPMVFKSIEAKQAQAAKTADQQDRLDERAKEAQYKNQMLQLQREQVAAQREVASNEKHEKLNQDQENKMNQQALSLRGNPAIQQDMRTLQRVQNMKSIIDQYPDKNKIPTDVLNMLTADVATIASGGVPGEGLIHDLSQSTYASKFSEEARKFLNHPTGANAAAFINQNQKIIDTLSNDAQKRLADRYQHIGNTFGRTISPEGKERYRQEYIPNHQLDANGMFVPKQQKTQSVTSGMVKVMNPKTNKVYEMSPEDAKKAIAAGGIAQ